jgi:hypothetical protein
MNPRLPVHEWLAIVVLLSVIATLISIALLNRPHIDMSINNANAVFCQSSGDAIQVSIDGAVAHPDTYVMKKGATLRELFAIAEPLPEARLNRFHLDRTLADGESLFIGKQKMVTVYIQGAVKTPQTLIVRQGTPMCDLEALVTLEEDAKVSFLHKKRKLKDGETITIPRVQG